MDEKNQFDPDKDPFYKHADVEHFGAYREGRLVGRVSAIVDHNFNKAHGEQTGFFGFFESFDDKEVSGALLEAAERWLTNRGMTRMMGPVNLSTNHVIGMLIDGYDIPPVVQMGYNPPYYPGLMEAYGLSKYKDLYSYRMTTKLPLSDKISRIQEIARKRGKVTIRDFDMKRDWDNLVEVIRDIYNDAWANNWGFVPWTEEEFAYLAKDMKLIIDPEMVFVADVEGEAAAVALPLPDINQVLIKMNGRLFPFGIFKLLAGKGKIDMIRVAVLGVRKKFQNKGLDGILIYELYTRGQARGLNSADLSWVLEENYDLRNLLESWGTEHYKTHRVYSKPLLPQSGPATQGPT
jgi:GNAT superfamily N-acetyltransferase